MNTRTKACHYAGDRGAVFLSDLFVILAMFAVEAILSRISFSDAMPRTETAFATLTAGLRELARTKESNIFWCVGVVGVLLSPRKDWVSGEGGEGGGRRDATGEDR